MAASSMTGFGRAEAEVGGVRLVVEIVSVNQKALQAGVHGPDCWPTLESAASGWIRAHLVRGKVTAKVTRVTAASSRLWNADEVRAALEELSRLAALNKIPFEPDAGVLLRLAETGRGGTETLPSFDAAEPALRKAFASALASLKAMRLAEGSALAADLAARVAKLSGMVEAMAAAESGAPTRHRANLLRRLREAGLQIDLSDERLLKELALFADRCDITEEVVRLRSHCSQFLEELPQPGAGRKLDFLVQELLREVNTIGSKAVEIATTRQVLEAKTEIERIREQVQNLE